MTPIYFFEFLVISTCVNIFTVFTVLYFYSNLIFKHDPVLNFTYDYIIVGSGTAGSLIAKRIAEETNYTIIVIEVGGKSHAFHDIPVLGSLLYGSIYDWQYETVPQNNACFAMENHKCKQTQGKIVGGSAKLNNMIHVRGNISNYVDWFHGKYNAEYIEKQFDFIDNNIFKISDIQYHSGLSEAFLNAAKELGYKTLNKQFTNGFSSVKVTQNNGKRWTTSDLDISKYVLTNTLVEKLLIRSGKCYGVQLHENSQKLYARKGVIIAAGAFNSAKILQLSGIGPKDLLKSLNIQIKKDLPVGMNLQDHIGTGLDLIMFNKSLSITTMDIMNPFNALKYFLNGKGPFTSPGCEAIGFISTKNEATPNLQFMMLPVGISTDKGSHLKKSLGITADIWHNYFAKLFDKYTATIFPVILHPKSTGYVHIQNKDPTTPPLINPQYLSHSEDVKVLREGLKIVKKLIETNSLKNVGAELNTVKFPNCTEFVFFSDDYLECYIQHLTLSSFHPVGTCSMGLPGSNETVVDTSFKVIDIDNLYVVDASVLPTLPSCNINAAIAMMANLFFENNIKQLIFTENCICDNFYSYVKKICLLN